MEIYTLGGIIDNLKLNQVAVKVNSGCRDNEIVHESETRIFRLIGIGEAFFYNEQKGGILQRLSDNADAHVTYAEPKEKGEYIILSIEDYLKMKEK